MVADEDCAAQSRWGPGRVSGEVVWRCYGESVSELVISQVIYDTGKDEYRALATEPTKQDWEWREISAEDAREIAAELQATLERDFPYRYTEEEDGLHTRRAPAIIKRFPA